MSLIHRIEEIARRTQHQTSVEVQMFWATVKRECAHLMEPDPVAPQAPNHSDAEILERLDQLEKNVMSSIEHLQAEIAQLKTVVANAADLINGFPDKLAAAVAAAKAGDDAAVDAATADLTTSVDALNAAVAAASPAPAPVSEPTPEPTPTPVPSADPAPATPTAP